MTDLLEFSVPIKLANPVSQQGFLASRQGFGQLGLCVETQILVSRLWYCIMVFVLCRDMSFCVATAALQCETKVCRDIVFFCRDRVSPRLVSLHGLFSVAIGLG